MPLLSALPLSKNCALSGVKPSGAISSTGITSSFRCLYLIKHKTATPIISAPIITAVTDCQVTTAPLLLKYPSLYTALKVMPSSGPSF